jgi:hypothetical protein
MIWGRFWNFWNPIPFPVHRGRLQSGFGPEKILVAQRRLIAEFWAIQEALLFAKSCSITELDLYTDSTNNLSWLKGRIGESMNDRASVLDIFSEIDHSVSVTSN